MVLALSALRMHFAAAIHPQRVQGRAQLRPPAAPVAQHWIDDADKRVRTDADDLSKWWTVFHDPGAGLPRLLRVPAEHHVARGGLPGP